MKIGRRRLEAHGACADGKEFFLVEGILSPISGVVNLLNKNKVDWANWLVVRLMTHPQKVAYSVYAAKQVLGDFEKVYPSDRRPRLAIAAALRFAAHPTEGNRRAALVARIPAFDAYSHAFDANNYSSIDGAFAAAKAAFAAFSAAYSASSADTNTNYDIDVDDTIKRKIVMYGLRLLSDSKGGTK